MPLDVKMLTCINASNAATILENLRIDMATLLKIADDAVATAQSDKSCYDAIVEIRDANATEIANEAKNFTTAELAYIGAAEIKPLVIYKESDDFPIGAIIGIVVGVLCLLLLFFLLLRKRPDEDETRPASTQVVHTATFGASETNERTFDDQPLLEMPTVAQAAPAAAVAPPAVVATAPSGSYEAANIDDDL